MNYKMSNKYMKILKKNFPHCFTRGGEFNFKKFQEELSKNVITKSEESYEMNWLGKQYAIFLANEDPKTFLKEDVVWNKKKENKNSNNLLLKGDNLEVLKHLSNAYFEKVKIIYIDPPYNTGSDGFVYHDKRTFNNSDLSELLGVEEEKAKAILRFISKKNNSHSAWLTFMYPRLYIARFLLKNDGVIFVSIDDNEMAQLKILMDEIFGEENFVGTLIHQRASGGGQAKNIVKGHDYILVYAKNLSQEVVLTRKKIVRNKIVVKDGVKYLLDDDVVRKKFGKYDKSLDRRCFYEELNQYKSKEKIQEIEEKLEKGEYILKKNSAGRSIICKLVPINEARSKIYSILKYDTIVKKLSEKGKNDLEDLGIPIFNYPKPVELIDFLISSISFKKNDIVLDFFAGSGTTGHSAMKLGINFILVQIDELLNHKVTSKKGNIEQEYRTIFDVTKKRLIRASKKIVDNVKRDKKDIKKQIIVLSEDQTKKSNKTKTKLIERLKELEAKEQSFLKHDLGFKIFETIPIWENFDFKSKKYNKQKKFFDETKLSDEDLNSILTTWKIYDGIPLTQDLKKIDLDGYVGYFCTNRLYLINKGFKRKNLKRLLEEIDKNESFNPKTIVVFGYNFESKTMREIAENTKNYPNSKQVDISFTIR